MLRPGVHVLRRSATELQVGLDPRRALVLPDRPGVRGLLASLRSPASLPPEEYDDRTLGLLAEAGLLVDADVLLPLVPDRPTTDLTAAGPRAGQRPPVAAVDRPDAAAVAAQSGEAAEPLLRARADARIEVVACGSPEAARVAAILVDLLTTAGVPCSRRGPGTQPPDGPGPGSGPGRSGRPRRRAPAVDVPGTGVLVTVGEPARDRVDGWMRDGTPHLLLRLVEGYAVVGPFVRPGETACLRCIDAHHTDADPAWPLLVAQYAAAVTRPREDTVPEPVDAVLATLAAAWAARELVSHAEGRTPSVTGATIRLDPHLTALETCTWPRHPACGCSWT